MKRIAWVVALLALGYGPAPGQVRGGHGRGGQTGVVGGAAHGHGRGMRAQPPGVYSHGAIQAPRTYGSPHGFGNVVFPGTGHAPGTYSPFSITDPTFGLRLSNTVSGFGQRPFHYSGGHGGFGHRGVGGTVVLPYAVPVYVPYPEPQPQIVAPPPQIIYIVPGAPERSLTTTAPPQRESVVTYVVPSRNGATETTQPARKFYLIALRNHSIYSATDYWLEGDTLHYITTQGVHNQASLDQIDLEFTMQLNRERGLEFRLQK